MDLASYNKGVLSIWLMDKLKAAKDLSSYIGRILRDHLEEDLALFL
ncbi:hypothetical protein SAMN05428981_11276 [Bacillus sp. OV194]|nr:hypothetical protein SAMN05428981_11276 [Bacillus sp. OV194]